MSALKSSNSLMILYVPICFYPLAFSVGIAFLLFLSALIPKTLTKVWTKTVGLGIIQLLKHW